MAELSAWQNGHWRAQSAIAIGLFDLGFVQGATAVERLRTINGSPLDVPEHLSRFHETCAALGIELPAGDHSSSLSEVIARCALENQSVYRRDFSIVILATPGIPGVGAGEPTLIVHTAPIDWSTLAKWYQCGQDLVISHVQNVPAACWSPTWKVRSRLQYYLAACNSNLPAGTGFVLLNEKGCLTETANANLLIVEQGRLVVAPTGTVLNGISLQRTIGIAKNVGVDIVEAPLDLQRCRAAHGILLSGTTGCLWTAARLGDTEFPEPNDLEIFRLLRDNWCTAIELDYIAQAEQASNV